ncbi:MAG: tetratricopeptide repeat protein [Planctomycetes bacterium]|nr:tetratricopeptide repeat protein [Planctomycetota bacterium]
MTPPRATSLLLAAGLLAPLWTLPTQVSAAPAVQAQGEDLDQLLALERREADRLRRRGDYAEARKLLGEHLRDDEGDATSRALLARVALDQADWTRAERYAERAFADAQDGAQRVAAGSVWVELLLALGRAEEAEGVLRDFEHDLDPERDPEAAWLMAAVRRARGAEEAAELLLRRGASGEQADRWQQQLARARCRRALGDLEGADRALIAADRQAREGEGEEPAVLAELGSLYFEADREVEEGASRSASKAYDAALAIDATNEAALLGQFEVHRTNWMRQKRSAGEFLERALEARPDSIDARLAEVSSRLVVGRLDAARVGLRRLEGLAPARRDVRALRAALDWIEHDREGCEALLAELAAERPRDSAPERTVGQHLVELYRFAEALPFAERAVERDPSDYMAWTLLGRARANTGDEPGALEALVRSEVEGGLRQDAWRRNMRLVLERLARDYVEKDFGELSFAWMPDAAAVLETYLEPFYREAREELAERYGYTPEPTHIEVFRAHEDFSVRSTGFQGFPALGVCFGPVVTAVSPLSELRRSFSWARTSFHEFTHVIHLGLSHNRCPRWITEGLATWEEKTRNPAWDRNMRRDLIDARANGALIPVRDLNAAFRGPRILFGYYEGGLLCQLLIERYGFAPVIRVLEAFDRGLDLDQALREVYGLTPEELDREFAAFVDRELEGLRLEPRWTAAHASRVRLTLPRELPADAAGRVAWGEDWTTIAWAAWQAGAPVDAQEALRRAAEAGAERPRASFLRAEMALDAGDTERAIELYEAGLAAGGEDYRARVALGTLLAGRDDMAGAEAQFRAAEACFPGFDESALSAELKLVHLYIAEEREDEAMQAAERYLAYDAGDFDWRRRVARWHEDHERWEEAARLHAEANEIDPFSRRLHVDWARALEHLGRWEEAAREYRVARLVPADLDSAKPGPLKPEQAAALLAGEGRALLELGRLDDARARLAEAQELDAEGDEVQALAARLGE